MSGYHGQLSKQMDYSINFKSNQDSNQLNDTYYGFAVDPVNNYTSYALSLRVMEIMDKSFRPRFSLEV